MIADEYRAQILQMLEDGYSFYKIGKVLGISHSSVERGAKKWGCSTNFPRQNTPTHIAGGFRCSKCGEVKPREAFIERKDGKGLRFSFCRQCKGKQWVELCRANYKSYISHLFSQIKHRARLQNVPFNLTKEYLIELWEKQNGKCFYTDTALELSQKRQHNVHSPGLDKIIPRLGYTMGNVVWTVQRINAMKNDATLEEMSLWMPGWFKRIEQKIKTDPDSISLRSYLPSIN